MSDTFYTFAVSGTFAATDSTPAASLSGTITVDETTGEVVAVNLVAGSITFTSILSQEIYSTGQWQLQVTAPAPGGVNYELTLIFTTPDTADVSLDRNLDSLIGFHGGTILGATDSIKLNGVGPAVLGWVSGTILLEVGSGQTYTVSSGQTDIGDIVLLGGTLNVLSGGAASNTVDSGGADNVLAGGTAFGTTVSSGGIEHVYGTASSTTVLSGGTLELFGGGHALGATVNAGGIMEFGSGYTGTGFVVTSGVVLDVASSGIASATTVSGGGSAQVLSGGRASATTVFVGGFEIVSAGGIDQGAKISGGTQYDYGSASGDAIYGGGFQIVESGGIATGTKVNRGGLEYVSSGGTASATTLSGGKLEVANGGSIGSGAITFTSAGGDLQLDASQSFHGLIAGFGFPHGVTEEIDLRDIVFGKHTKVTFTEASNHLSGTLKVTDGTHTADLTLLGQYSAAHFSLSSDGHGGTFVTDTPVTASDQGLNLASHP